MLPIFLLTLLQGSVCLGRPQNDTGRYQSQTLDLSSPVALNQVPEPTATADIKPRHWWFWKKKYWEPPSRKGENRHHCCRYHQPNATVTVTVNPQDYIGVVTSAAKVVTTPVASGVVQSLVSRKVPAPGVFPSRLEIPSGQVTVQPILTDEIPTPTSFFSAAPTLPPSPEVSPEVDENMRASDIFANPIATDAPPGHIAKREDHPAPRIGIHGTAPFETNKFYANFFLGNQTCPTYLHPYSVSWARGKGASSSWGLAISHVSANQRVYGQTNVTTGAAKYYINPVGIQAVSISAQELGPDTVLTTSQLTDTSVRVNLSPSAQTQPTIEFPLVQGSAFVTAIFNGGTPLFQTGLYYQTVTRSTKEPKPGITKYKLHLEDGSTWILYALHTKGDALDLEVVNNGLAQSKKPFYGIVQVAKDPGNGENLYDAASGAYPTCTLLSGSVDGKRGTYTFTFEKQGMKNATLAMFALPHHLASFDDATRGRTTAVQLQTTTKGIATAVLSDSWTMVENSLPTDIGFLPWVPNVGSVGALSEDTKTYIHNIARQEISQNMIHQTDQNSMYFSGKALAKFAKILIAIHDILGDKELARSGLEQLKIAFAKFAENKQQYPLVYESAWGGVVSSASYHTGDAGADFGNTYYNDHHFHYGYFIYTAAVIGHLDHSWIAANKAYVNMLVRDVANPSTKDSYFPVWRAFDWYHGHSWAHGLFETLDGKDQESSSEDTMHAYALKMWGSVSGDQNMAARGNLMLAIQTRALQAYYLYTSVNTVQPVNFIGNKVAGILFENKIDHTTYFGTNIEYIQGIHMLPLLPHTPMVRTPEFVAEEWDTYFSNGRADGVVGGWKGILFANYATIDPRGAYAFFSQPNFDPSWLDGGASLTWYLCYSAAVGGL